jgi:pseudouridine synthase
VRLQTFLARAGIASRRASEELIAAGRVFVNGVSVTAPGTKVRPGVDRVAVDGEPVEVQPTTWIALHKPKGYVTTRQDQYGRRTVYDLLPERFHSLFHVGRLDRDSEGIILLTNEGEVANRMLHPSFGITKEYWADVEGKPTSEQLHRLTEGVEDEGETLRAEEVRRLHQVDENVFRLQLVLREGKKREVRRMLAAVGHPVRRLIRRRFGPVSLGELPSGKWRVVTPAELASLRAKPTKSPAGAAKPTDAGKRPAGGAKPGPGAAKKPGGAGKPAGGGAKTGGGAKRAAAKDFGGAKKAGGAGKGDGPPGKKAGGTKRPSRFTPRKGGPRGSS